MRSGIATAVFFFVLHSAQGQSLDTLIEINSKLMHAQIFHLNSQYYIYPKPKTLTFVTSLPKTFKNIARMSFQRKAIKPWILITGSTLALWTFDQKISNHLQQFSRFIHLDYSRRYINVIKFNLKHTEVNVYQAPDNLNTAIYSVGEGLPSILLGAGLLVHGLSKNDNRSMSTASQIMQGNIALGFATQFLKRIAGRQSPFTATKDRGEWHPFPRPKTYQKNVAQFDAFPSGHMATMMTTTVILADNYPEKRWIRPVGYSLMAIVGLAMINNEVHWASDYPLAIGMGYVFGKVVVNMNRLIRDEKKGRH